MDRLCRLVKAVQRARPAPDPAIAVVVAALDEPAGGRKPSLGVGTQTHLGSARALAHASPVGITILSWHLEPRRLSGLRENLTLARIERTLTTRGYELASHGAVPAHVFLRYLEQIRWEALSDEQLRFGELFLDGNHMVVRAQQLHVIAQVSFGIDLRISMWVGRVGRASADFHHEVRQCRDHALVARAVVTGVYLTPEGRPQQLPSVVAEVAEPDDQPPLIEPLRSRAPTEAWSHVLAARLSDADVLQHVNQSNYLAYFEDVRWLGAQAGAYGQHSALAQRECAKAAIDYRRQVLVGDELRVATWALDDDPLCLGFEAVRKGDRELVCSARVEVAGQP